jgi:predicted ATPase/class 3 adenylate cyclase
MTGADPGGSVRTLAFLFTDIEGSTRLWERHPEAMGTALAEHDRLLRSAVDASGGRIVKTTGDGVMAVFATARDGLAAGLAAQLALLDAEWGVTGPLRVRIGLHVGDAAIEEHGDEIDYHGQAVNRAARIMAAGHGGQTLLSESTAALVLDQLPAEAGLRDLGEHQLKDLSRPEHVYELLHPRLPDVALPLTTEDATAHGLPAEPSSFIGRNAERARIGAALEDGATRLLTLTGPGGIGKTRLALRVAWDVEHRYRASAIFVDLSDARDTSAVLVAISRELGLADASEGAQLEELAGAIGTRQLLMVLDNFEQVAASAPVLARLLADCPALTLLVTSREALHVRGERLFAVTPLVTPRQDQVTSAADIATSEAVQLFVDRARAVQPDFEVRDEDARVLAEICERLEGVPLAIELATARLRVFSLETLRDRLERRLGVLGSGARDLPERQRTLRATIEWSYQLLPPSEQRLLAVTSCFAGADMPSIEAVAAALGRWLIDIDPIEGILSLNEKSLLRRIDKGDEPRFAMLESVREFAGERLDLEPDLATAARAAQADHFASWSVGQVSALNGQTRAEALERISTEVGNLRLAWACSVAERDLARLEPLLAVLGPLYEARGWYRALIGLAEDMLTVVGSMPSSDEHAVLAATLRSRQLRALASMDGYTDEVESAYEQLLDSFGGGDPPQVYPILRSLASLHTFRVENDKAVELGRRILDLGDEERDVSMKVAGHMVVGTARSFLGRVTDGLPELEAAAELLESTTDAVDWYRVGPDPRVACLTALSLLRWWEGSLERSLRRSDQALTLARAGGHPSTLGYALHHAALLRTFRSEPGPARDTAVQVIDLSTEHDLHIWRAVGTVILGAATVALGQPSEGLRWVSEGLDRYRGLRTPPVFWPFLLQITADACARAGELRMGLDAVGEALAVVPHSPDLLLARGDLLLATDEPAAAAEFERAWTAARAWGAKMPALRAALRLARLGQPAPRSGAEKLREVLAELTEELDFPDIVEAQTLLADVGGRA